MPQVIPYEKDDYLEEMRDRVTFAFEDSPIFDRFLRLLNAGNEDLQEVFRQLLQERSVDTAVGAQLDIIGDIVGQPRVLIQADNMPFFGFMGHSQAESYGDENIPSVGGFYWDENKPLAGDVTLSDTQYRLFIKAKIIKNVTRGTPEDIIRFIEFVFGVEVVNILTDSDAHTTILVDDSLNNFELSLLQYFITSGEYLSHFVPKVLGVKYSFGVIPPFQLFGFIGAPGALGYGTLEDGEVVGGGVDATIIR